MRTRTMLAAVLLAVITAGIVRGSASGLGAVAGPDVSSGDEVVLSPPVVVSALDWEPEWEDAPPPGQYRVRVLHVEFTFTSDFVGPLMVRFMVTGDTPLPEEFYQVTGNLDKQTGETEEFSFVMDSLNVPVEAVQDLHIMVCDHNPADGIERCRLP